MLDVLSGPLARGMTWHEQVSCRACGRAFKSHESLAQHLETAHGGINSEDAKFLLLLRRDAQPAAGAAVAGAALHQRQQQERAGGLVAALGAGSGGRDGGDGSGGGGGGIGREVEEAFPTLTAAAALGTAAPRTALAPRAGAGQDEGGAAAGSGHAAAGGRRGWEVRGVVTAAGAAAQRARLGGMLVATSSGRSAAAGAPSSSSVPRLGASQRAAAAKVAATRGASSAIPSLVFGHGLRISLTSRPQQPRASKDSRAVGRGAAAGASSVRRGPAASVPSAATTMALEEGLGRHKHHRKRRQTALKRAIVRARSQRMVSEARRAFDADLAGLVHLRGACERLVTELEGLHGVLGRRAAGTAALTVGASTAGMAAAAGAMVAQAVEPGAVVPGAWSAAAGPEAPASSTAGVPEDDTGRGDGGSSGGAAEGNSDGGEGGKAVVGAVGGDDGEVQPQAAPVARPPLAGGLPPAERARALLLALAQVQVGRLSPCLAAVWLGSALWSGQSGVGWPEKLLWAGSGL